MICGIKILHLPVAVDEIRQNKYLDFISHDTGELLRSNGIAKYNGIYFNIPPDERAVKLFGSLHVYHNAGEHNYNDFTYHDLANSIIDLCSKFHINPHTAVLNNVEFGVNILLDYSPSEFVNRLIQHKNKYFTISRAKNKCYAECSHNRYYLKIYDKGLQNELKENILRIEIKIIKMRELRYIGVKFLSDLLNPEVLKRLGVLLTDSFNDILYSDATDEANLDQKQQQFIDKYSNPTAWQQLYTDHRATYYKGNYQQRFKELIQSHGKHKFHEIQAKISKKWNELLQVRPQAVQKITDFENMTGCPILPDKYRTPQTDKIPKNHNLYIQLIFRPEHNHFHKRCLITGLAIDMQKDNSKFLCLSGISFYREHYPDVYRQLLNLLSDKWLHAPDKVKHREIAHKVRNAYFNKYHNAKRDVSRLFNDAALFDSRQYIRQEKRQLAGI